MEGGGGGGGGNCISVLKGSMNRDYIIFDIKREGGGGGGAGELEVPYVQT